MNEMCILRSLGQVDDNYIAEADPAGRQSKKMNRGIWIPLAAGLFICFGSIAYLRVLQPGLDSPAEITDERTADLQALADSAAETDDTSETGKVYFVECRMRNLLGLPAEIEEKYVGEHIGYVRRGGLYDYEETSAESDIEILKYVPDLTEGVYILREGNDYTPVVLCDTTYKGNETFKLQGEERPQKVAEIQGGSLVLPQAEMISFYGTTAGTGRERMELTEEEMWEMIAIIERAERIEPDNAMNPDRKMYGCDMFLFLQDGSGSQIGVALKPFDDGFTGVNIWYEDPEYADRQQFFFLHSGELTEAIKKITGWRLVELSELSSVKQIVLKNGSCIYQLESDECEKLLEGMERASLEHADTICPFDVQVLLYPKNGETIRGLWCNDSCEYLALEGGVYRLREEDARYIDELCERFTTEK